MNGINFEYEAVVDQTVANVTTRTIHECDAGLKLDVAVLDTFLIVDMSKGMDQWLDSLSYMSC